MNNFKYLQEGKEFQRQISSNASSFEDRGEARLILDLENAIANSPKFDLNLFRSSLESKDMYGNEQVSKQHVIQAKICTKYRKHWKGYGSWQTVLVVMSDAGYFIPNIYFYCELWLYYRISGKYLFHSADSSCKKI